MFKRWRALAAAAGAICFPFALAHAALPYDNATQCTRYNYSNYRDRAPLDSQENGQDGWHSAYFRSFSTDRITTDEQPGCFNSNASNDADPARGGNDDFSVSLGFEETDDQAPFTATDECLDPDCASKESGVRPDNSESDTTSVNAEISFEALDDEAVSARRDAAEDDACPCYDAIILELLQLLDDETDAAAARSTSDATPGVIPLFDVLEPFSFDYPEFDPTCLPRPPAVEFHGVIEIDEPDAVDVQSPTINELGDGAVALPAARLMGTIEFFDENEDADNENAADALSEPASDDSANDSACTPTSECSTVTPGLVSRFHMFYPGYDWSSYVPAEATAADASLIGAEASSSPQDDATRTGLRVLTPRG